MSTDSPKSPKAAYKNKHKGEKNAGIPPYFNLSPKDAFHDLSQPITTQDLEEIARIANKGRNTLVTQGIGQEQRKTLRLFSTWEITRYLIPVAQGHFRRVLKNNPELPQGKSETNGGAKWFTLEEVLKLREFFASEGVKNKDYLPYRPKNVTAKMIAVANFKGGVGKTSTCAHLAMSAALDGYRVLMIDLDAQGSMTSIFGGHVKDEWQTAFPLVAGHYARHIQNENRRKVDRGESPVALDETLLEALKISASDLIQKTHWPNIDLIGSQLNLYWAEFQIPVWRMQAKGWKLWDALADSLSENGILEKYDLIFLDTPPALGYLTINGLAAADIILVPVGASFLEFDSTGRFFDMLHATFSSIEDGENIAARALGQPELVFEWDAVRTIITRYDASQQAEMAAFMQAFLGRRMTNQRQEFTALIGQAGEQTNGIYEADYRDFNRETYIRGRETFDATWAEFKKLLYGIWYKDETASENHEL